MGQGCGSKLDFFLNIYSYGEKSQVTSEERTAKLDPTPGPPYPARYLTLMINLYAKVHEQSQAIQRLFV